MADRYADVIIDISHEKVDRPFQYKIPPELSEAVYPGVQVHVPFGKGNAERTGYVVDISEETDYPKEKIKEILSVDARAITAQSNQIQIAYWMKRQYGSTTITALKTVLPVKQKLKQLEKKKVSRCIAGEELLTAIEVCEKKHQVAKARALRAFLTEEVLPYDLLCQKGNVNAATLRSLEKQGYVTIQAENYYRNPVKQQAREETRVSLSEEQRHII